MNSDASYLLPVCLGLFAMAAAGEDAGGVVGLGIDYGGIARCAAHPSC